MPSNNNFCSSFVIYIFAALLTPTYHDWIIVKFKYSSQCGVKFHGRYMRYIISGFLVPSCSSCHFYKGIILIPILAIVVILDIAVVAPEQLMFPWMMFVAVALDRHLVVISTVDERMNFSHRVIFHPTFSKILFFSGITLKKTKTFTCLLFEVPSHDLAALSLKV